MENIDKLTTIELAQYLLGKKIIVYHEDIIVSCYIVETEAYLGVIDQACHTYEGRRTPKVEAMYQEAGTIYIYSMHGHYMLNIVSRDSLHPEAVLIRAVEPAEGVDYMRLQRNKELSDLTNGPGKLTRAMGINASFNRQILNSNQIIIDLKNSRIPKKIITTARIGIPNKGEWTDAPLRFYVDGNPFVSKTLKKSHCHSCDSWTK